MKVERVAPEDPWWWPMGPVTVVWMCFVALLGFSNWWPLSPAGERVVVGALQVLVALGLVVWVGAFVGLRVRHQRRSAPMDVLVDDQGMTVDGRRLLFAELSRVEWSPFGLLTEDLSGVRSHLPARVTDDQAVELQAACDRARGLI